MAGKRGVTFSHGVIVIDVMSDVSQRTLDQHRRASAILLLVDRFFSAHSTPAVYVFHKSRPLVTAALQKERKGKEEYLYSAFLHQGTHKALRYGSHSFTCKQQHACLSFEAFTRCHHHSN